MTAVLQLLSLGPASNPVQLLSQASGFSTCKASQMLYLPNPHELPGPLQISSPLGTEGGHFVLSLSGHQQIAGVRL